MSGALYLGGVMTVIITHHAKTMMQQNCKKEKAHF